MVDKAKRQPSGYKALVPGILQAADAAIIVVPQFVQKDVVEERQVSSTGSKGCAQLLPLLRPVLVHLRVGCVGKELDNSAQSWDWHGRSRLIN